MKILNKIENLVSVLGGMVAFSWLSGRSGKFSDKPRSVEGDRPLLCVTHVREDGQIMFGPSICRPRNGRLNFRPLADLHAPVQVVLGSDKKLLKTVAQDHLHRLVDWAYAQKRSPIPAPAPVFPRLLECTSFAEAKFAHVSISSPDFPELMNSGRIFEDYTPVLGAFNRNPAMYLVRPANPAKEALSALGIVGHDLMHQIEAAENQETLIAAIVSEMRKRIPLEVRYTDNEILTAACHHLTPDVLKDKKGQSQDAADRAAWDEVVRTNPDAVVQAMKAELPQGVVNNCVDADIYAAAQDPFSPLVVRYRSFTQVTTAQNLLCLPAGYSGDVLPRVDNDSPAAVEDDMEAVTAPVAAPAPVEA